MKPVTKIIAVSNAVQDDIARTNWIAKSKIKVIYNGIDTQKYQLSSISKVEAKKQVSPKNCDKLWVGTAGRMVPTKGHTYLLEAFSILRKQHKNIQLVLAGDGRLRPELVSMSKKLGIQEHVTFTGHFNNMPLFYKSLDMFLFPSIAEGMPLSVMEAMAAGVPVIASNVGGIPEIFGDEFSRYLVNPADTDSLLSGLDNLVSAGYLEREKLGDAKRKRIESNFTEKIMLDQLADTYMAFTGDTLSGRP